MTPGNTPSRRGGARPGAGRPPGARDNQQRTRTKTAEPRAQTAISAALLEAVRQAAASERCTIRVWIETAIRQRLGSDADE